MNARKIVTISLFVILSPGISNALNALVDSSATSNTSRQQSLDEEPRPSVSVAIGELRYDEVVRVRTLDIGRVEGRYLGVSRDALLLKGVEGELHDSEIIRFAFIDSLWVKRTKKLKAAAVGGLAGAGVGAFLGAALGLQETGAGDFTSEGEAALLGMAMGAAAGLVVGGIVGLLFGRVPTWSRIHP